MCQSAYAQPSHHSSLGAPHDFVLLFGWHRYVSETVVHDELALLSQLGLTNLSAAVHPDTAAAPHDCRTNRPTWGWQPPTRPVAALNMAPSRQQAAMASAQRTTSEASECGSGSFGATDLVLAALAGTLLTLASVGGYLLLRASSRSAQRKLPMRSMRTPEAEATTETSFVTPFALLSVD